MIVVAFVLVCVTAVIMGNRSRSNASIYGNGFVAPDSYVINISDDVIFPQETNYSDLTSIATLNHSSSSTLKDRSPHLPSDGDDTNATISLQLENLDTTTKNESDDVQEKIQPTSQFESTEDNPYLDTD